MPNSTGLIYNSPTSGSMATQIIVTCINDSLNIPANIELEVFKWDTTQNARVPIGHDLFQIGPQVSRTLVYPLITAAFYEVQSDYFSATSTIIHVYGVDSTGGVIQRVLQSEMIWVDRFTNIP
ncbi:MULTISPECIES: hypothetical protein [unclassified Paenibacillus]|uniref:hypothetical protein n=1 Tax=unclassified Paenibacillus TaxID=185978 RepID=UPI0008BD664E|nr:MULTISPECIES: hypothetical protein [unclassified Paenibacillus]QLG40676.1 hypothetical protein HW560_22925 [Paenibacillus sp. E222]SEN61476.1 hypothetical protein SAMN05518670_2271 [Paenibacillus sp. OK076]